MTVAGIIEQYNNERPNQIADEVKVSYLKRLEQMIINEIINSHDHDLADQNELSLKVTGNTLYITEAGTLTNHMDTFDMDTELLVPMPYDDVYLFYLDQRIAYDNNDKTRYNIASTQYNNALLTYQQYFNRTYETVKREKRLFRHDWI